VATGRVAGILLHPTSLPGPYGIGELGDEARAFLDFLHETRQGLWQVLPLGPTGYGDSPYQCFSAFAGNPLLVSLDQLRKDGLLSASDLAGRPALPSREVDFGAVKAFKQPLLAKACASFENGAEPTKRAAFEAFCREHASWLDDFGLFMALKEANGGRAWHTWDRAVVNREPDALERARGELAREIRTVRLTQFFFFEQWAAVRDYAHERAISIMGDLPIFVAHDSADVWAHPELFTLAAIGSLVGARLAYVINHVGDYASSPLDVFIQHEVASGTDVSVTPTGHYPAQLTIATWSCQGDIRFSIGQSWSPGATFTSIPRTVLVAAR